MYTAEFTYNLIYKLLTLLEHEEAVANCRTAATRGGHEGCERRTDAACPPGTAHVTMLPRPLIDWRASEVKANLTLCLRARQRLITRLFDIASLKQCGHLN